MEKTNLLTLVVTLTVGIILAGSLLMPVLADTTATEKTYTNTGYFTMDKLKSDAEFTLTWDQATPNIIDIDGEKIDLSDRGLTSGKLYTIFGADNFVLRVYWANSPFLQYFGQTSVIPAFITATSAGSKFTATVTGGNITFASTDPSYPDPVTIELTDTAYCINALDKGNYIMKNADESVFIETDTDIIVLDGLTNLYANDVGIYAEGTIDGDLTATTFRGDGTYDVSFKDWTYDTTDVDEAINLVKLKKVVFTATQNDTDYEVTYSYFIVPATVTAELSEHLNAGEIALLNALPILVIIGLVMAGVGAIFIRNRD